MGGLQADWPEGPDGRRQGEAVFAVAASPSRRKRWAFSIQIFGIWHFAFKGACQAAGMGFTGKTPAPHHICSMLILAKLALTPGHPVSQINAQSPGGKRLTFQPGASNNPGNTVGCALSRSRLPGISSIKASESSESCVP